MNQQHTTAEQSVSKTKAEVIKEAQRIEEASTYSSKGHFKAADFWSIFHLVIGCLVVILAAAASTSFMKEAVGLAKGLSVVTAVLSAMMTFLNPNERSSSHLDAGNNYDSLLNRVRIFRTIECWGSFSEQELTDKLKNLSGEKDKLNENSPQVPSWAYYLAKRGILAGEGHYEVDKSKAGRVGSESTEGNSKLAAGVDKPEE